MDPASIVENTEQTWLFCLISSIRFVYIKKKLQLKGLKWVMIKQNE